MYVEHFVRRVYILCWDDFYELCCCALSFHLLALPSTNIRCPESILFIMTPDSTGGPTRIRCVRCYSCVDREVKLPGKDSRSPQSFAFGTPYVEIRDILASQDEELFRRNSVLGLLERDAATKKAPERWQALKGDEVASFDVVVCFESRVFDLVVEGTWLLVCCGYYQLIVVRAVWDRGSTDMRRIWSVRRLGEYGISGRFCNSEKNLHRDDVSVSYSMGCPYLVPLIIFFGFWYHGCGFYTSAASTVNMLPRNRLEAVLCFYKAAV